MISPLTKRMWKNVTSATSALNACKHDANDTPGCCRNCDSLRRNPAKDAREITAWTTAKKEMSKGVRAGQGANKERVRARKDSEVKESWRHEFRKHSQEQKAVK